MNSRCHCLLTEEAKKMKKLTLIAMALGLSFGVFATEGGPAAPAGEAPVVVGGAEGGAAPAGKGTEGTKTATAKKPAAPAPAKGGAKK
jgi:hypothetical protein